VNVTLGGKGELGWRGGILGGRFGGLCGMGVDGVLGGKEGREVGVFVFEVDFVGNVSGVGISCECWCLGRLWVRSRAAAGFGRRTPPELGVVRREHCPRRWLQMQRVLVLSSNRDLWHGHLLQRGEK
jgi:hypothetical protein